MTRVTLLPHGVPTVSATMGAMKFATPGVVVMGAVLAAVVAGCEPSPEPEPVIESTAPASPEVAQKLVGPGCAAYTKKYATGPGSVAVLADQSAGEAIEDHPMLRLFASAISGEMNPKVKLDDELNAGEFTAFVPTDDAFSAKVPAQWARTLSQPENADALTDVLMYHLVVGQRGPSELTGELKTRGGQTVKITREDDDRIRIADQANVVCGGLRTANATIYLIDSVLMPADNTAAPTEAPSSP